MPSVYVGAFAAFVIAIFISPLAIRVLRKASQPIRNELGLASNQGKQRTPTMGGLIFILATLLAYGLVHLMMYLLGGTEHRPSLTGLILLGLLVGGGVIGLLDDLLKVWKKTPGGLAGRYKILGQLVVGVGLGTLALYLPNEAGDTVGSEYLSIARDLPWAHIGKIGAVALFVLMVAATSNAVNLTDGLDGLAGGAAAAVTSGYLLIAFWQYRHWCADADTPGCYAVHDPLEIALVAGAITGALIGFLWWNTSPAQIIMGDVGALGLGTLIAGMAMATHTVLLLPIMCGLFVVVTMSRIIQYISFKTTGVRVFRMTPLHHHFEMAGWSEVTIVTRFWVLAVIAVGLGVALFFTVGGEFG
ncbi:phospho-N-acetylmuramoyl-pentapeptide-transferase [Stackebrandtia albiflava]|uniref:Phospho-N-acetylmuramoyl-pentapeptide-transferase n=1 Tax=Stackebrandtia albiflava TaxID=406432 RepID=A0A562VA87_9ACTN|nr:phospho-N-acetylmuramoyl-pentapeptide-transferase [Stackebrandtia albiflava]TWJ14796.1 phospho-N-acetylmuramoyl-pentapeptide-transferase [Stackebrandtia albiflava]